MVGINSDNAAVLAGFTRSVLLEGEGASFAALIKPDTDLDGTFEAFDTDNQEWLMISGWLLDNVENLDESGN